MTRILFVLKYRFAYGSYGHGDGEYASSGLINSAKFVVDMLRDEGFDAKIVQVVDNNQIDREVHKFRPKIVIVEALWVVPEKFDILKKLHPNIKWVVRIHSNPSFLAQEGIAIDWIRRYLDRGVRVAFNDKRTAETFESVIKSHHILYLPNYYPLR